MKKGRLVLVLAIALLIASFLPLHQFLPALSSESGSYDLAAGGVNGPSAFMWYQSVSRLEVNIDGANKDVYFYITDTAGRHVLDAGRVYNPYNLEWRSQSFSSYRFNFDNTMSLFSHKYVDYTLRIYPYSTMLLFSGIALFLVAIWMMMKEENVVSKLRNVFFGKPESVDVTCSYCGTVYDLKLEKCPHCGARKKRDSARKSMN